MIVCESDRLFWISEKCSGSSAFSHLLQPNFYYDTLPLFLLMLIMEQVLIKSFFSSLLIRQVKLLTFFYSLKIACRMDETFASFFSIPLFIVLFFPKGKTKTREKNISFLKRSTLADYYDDYYCRPLWLLLLLSLWQLHSEK